MSRRKSNMTGADDEDEVLIFSSESPRADDALICGPPRKKKRALSAGVMDFESLNPSTEDSERCSSPVDHWGSTQSTFASDDDNDSSSAAWGHTGSTTSFTTSSPMSWSYSSEAPTNPFQTLSSTSTLPRKALSLPLSASRSEKALAALTLALANGAGGLNDYEPLLSMQDDSSSLRDYNVGELWD
jgi:hypothetical protein